MQSNRNSAESVAEDYYDSSDADNFYELVWGGEDIHIGLYEPGLTTFDASRKTVEKMAAQVKNLGPETRVLDLGAGYGGAARKLAASYGCHVTCLNLSEVQNERNRVLNQQQNLSGLVDVLHGSFEDIPCDANSFDVVWSQDAFLHSGSKQKVIEEVDRVLKAGGEIIFTDPMQSDSCPEGVLQAVYDRLSLDSLASPAMYRQFFQTLGYQELDSAELTHQLRTHYVTVRASLQTRYQELSENISEGYLDRMIQGLAHWVEAADKDYLAWGILHFQKAD